LLRAELIALHGAGSKGGAQFYMECAQIKVVGGTTPAKKASTVAFPGTYKVTLPFPSLLLLQGSTRVSVSLGQLIKNTAKPIVNANFDKGHRSGHIVQPVQHTSTDEL
jgi:Auxiliary Activity family 9 (formerly GH61)